MKKCLGGNTTDVETGAAESATFLDAGGFETKLGSFDGGDVPAGSTTDDDDVVVISGGSKASAAQKKRIVGLDISGIQKRRGGLSSGDAAGHCHFLQPANNLRAEKGGEKEEG